MALLSIILLFGLIGLLAYYLFQLQQRYQYFRQRGIPTPPFELFFGHLRQLWGAELYHRKLESWTKQYGKIYGIYEGANPMFVVSDPDFLEEVFVKQFSMFYARKLTIMDDIAHDVLFNSGTKWRRQRQVISPSFTAGKLKTMSPLINGCVSDFMKKLSAHADNGNEFDITINLKCLTMDVICRCAFGIDTDMQNNPDNIYFKKMVEMFSEPPFNKILPAKCAQLVPPLRGFIAQIFSFYSTTQMFINTQLLPLVSSTFRLNEMAQMWLTNRLRAIVEHRQKTPIPRIDLLHLMLQVATEETLINTTDDSKMENRLTQAEIVGNVFMFMAAGHETTANALAFAMYELARNPDVVEKLHAEIDELPVSADDNDDDEMKKYPDYDIIAQMPYMDLFVSEVLRMHPIGNGSIHRRAIEDTVVQGITIKKGSVVYPDMYSVHFDRELWGPDDPYLFVPERHQTKRHPMAYLAFGVGPRHCIAMRFALNEIKILLTRLLRDYTILPGEHLESKFKLVDAILISPKEIWVKIQKRNS